jgi:RNA polymerase primary sigma factor
VKCCLKHPQYIPSLDLPVGDDGDHNLGSSLLENGEASALDDAHHREMKDRLREVVNALPSYREREIINMRFGLGDGYSYTLEQVGVVFSVTRERIRQIEGKALRTLRRPNICQDLVEFLD